MPLTAKPTDETESRLLDTSIPWGNTLSLLERISYLQANNIVNYEVKCELGKERFNRWASEATFARYNLFNATGTLLARKLDSHQLSPSQLEKILALPGEYFEALSDIRPAWVDIFESAYLHYSDSDFLYADAEDAPVDLSVMLIIANPLIAWGLAQVRQNIASLKAEDILYPETIENSWLVSLYGELMRMIARVAALEMAIAKLQNALEGDTPEQRYRNFFLRLGNQQQAMKIWREYPLLARQLTEHIQTKVSVLSLFLTHLVEDKTALAEKFSTGHLGKLTELHLNQGDSHNGGKGVIIAKFASGKKIVYKPRCLEIENHFQQLLTWLNQKGAEPSFRVLNLLNRGDRGWVEFVAYAGCADEGEVERFYQRLGAYIALFYTLGANDFHSQNLIASGEYPVAIDLETLFHPSIVRGDSHPIDRLYHRANDDSVMKIGLLPRLVWSDENSAGIDISGIGGGLEQEAPGTTLCWDEPGTDKMQVTRDRFLMPNENNRPTLADNTVFPYQYRQAIVDGFTCIYKLLVEHQEEFGDFLNCFAADEVRVILRDTRTYGELLQASYHPDYLRDALDRDRLFDKLWLRTVHQPHISAAIEAEQQDLCSRDIPLFTTQPDSLHLCTSRSTQIENFFTETGMEAVKRRLESLCEADLNRQLWLIETSLTTLGQEEALTARSVYLLNTNVTNTLCGVTEKVARRLAELAIREGNLATWYDCRYLHGRWSTELAGLDLYDGLSGIALFLAYFGHIYENNEYTALAQAAFATVETYLRDDTYQPPCIGGYSGLGGILFTLSHLGTLWERPELIDLAECLINQHQPMITTDDQYDMVSGAAGYIAGLLSLYAIRPEPFILESAKLAGDHLLIRADRIGDKVSWLGKNMSESPLAGFSHGAAGIAYSLIRLYGVTGETSYLNTAKGALEFERTLYSKEQKNWLDKRDHLHTGCMTAWCHGAPGIGLARLSCLDYLDTPEIRDEIDTAIHTTLNSGFGHNHSLCHGDLGNLELLTEAGYTFNDDHLNSEIDRLIKSILRDIDESGWLCGLPIPVENPGLMTGLAGIGYQLLRLANPRKIPSILTLQPPYPAYF